MNRPTVVALVRGILEAAALAAVFALYQGVAGGDLPLSAELTPLALLGLRTLEGVLDSRIDPSKERGKLGRAIAGTTVEKRG